MITVESPRHGKQSISNHIYSSRANRRDYISSPSKQYGNLVCPSLIKIYIGTPVIHPCQIAQEQHSRSMSASAVTGLAALHDATERPHKPLQIQRVRPKKSSPQRNLCASKWMRTGWCPATEQLSCVATEQLN